MRKMIPRDMLPELRQLEDGLAQALNLLIEQRTSEELQRKGGKEDSLGENPVIRWPWRVGQSRG